jgi:hypothetical protein
MPVFSVRDDELDPGVIVISAVPDLDVAALHERVDIDGLHEFLSGRPDARRLDVVLTDLYLPDPDMLVAISDAANSFGLALRLSREIHGD